MHVQINNVEMMLNEFADVGFCDVPPTEEAVDLFIFQNLNEFQNMWPDDFIDELKKIKSFKSGNKKALIELIILLENEYNRMVEYQDSHLDSNGNFDGFDNHPGWWR